MLLLEWKQHPAVNKNRKQSGKLKSSMLHAKMVCFWNSRDKKRRIPNWPWAFCTLVITVLSPQTFPVLWSWQTVMIMGELVNLCLIHRLFPVHSLLHLYSFLWYRRHQEGNLFDQICCYLIPTPLMLFFCSRGGRGAGGRRWGSVTKLRS